jgi:hypothetical protein
MPGKMSASMSAASEQHSKISQAAASPPERTLPASPPSFQELLILAANRSFVVGLVGLAAVGNFIVQTGTTEYLYPEAWGSIPRGAAFAAGFIGGEIGVGHVLGETLGIGRSTETEHMPEKFRTIWVWGLIILALVFAGAEAMLPFINEVKVHKDAVNDAQHANVQVEQCPFEALAPVPPVPADQADDPVKRVAWNVQQRKLHEQDLKAIAQRAADCAGRQQKERETGQGKLVEAADNHSLLESPYRVVASVGLSLATAVLATFIGGFFRAVIGLPFALLRAIWAGLLALRTLLPGRRRSAP